MQNILIFTLVCLCMVSCKDEVIDPIYQGDYIFSGRYYSVPKSALEGKSEIHGSLEIDLVDGHDLSFLKFITRIVGDVNLSANEFSDLSFLSGIKRIEGKLIIYYNEGLLSLDGLENLQEIEGLEIRYNNPSLRIDAIKEVKITKSIWIANYEETIPVFSNIDTLLNVRLDGLGGIKDLSFLVNLTELSEDFFIRECKSVISLNGLQNLKKVRDFELNHLRALIDISALEHLEMASGILCSGNTKLTDYCPLKNILSTSPSMPFNVIVAPVEPTAEEIIANCP